MPQTLNGWKEIASFLHSAVSTVQRKEREEGLPVHRAGKGRTALVFTFPAEIRHWVRIQGALENQRNLRAKLRNLVHRHRERMTALLDQRHTILGVVAKAAMRTQGAGGAKRRMVVEEAITAMSRKFVQAQEQERTHIARELHDDVNQRLALLTIGLDELQQHMGLSSEVSDRLRELREQAADIASAVHALAHELHSSKLEYLGLVGAMKGWCKELGERQRMEFEFTSEGVPNSLPAEVSLCLLRVLQEALHNAAKHSMAKRARVELRGAADEVHLVVSDSGVGFDLRTALEGQGLGLTSMHERVRLVKGTMVVRSKPGAGTSIHTCVPLRFSCKSASATKAEFSLAGGSQVVQ